MYYLFELNYFPSITQFYSVTRNTVWQIADKDHILIFVKSGCCSITFSGETYLLNSGNIFFIPANHSYTRRSVNNTMCTMTYIHFAASPKIHEVDLPELTQKVTAAKNILDDQILNGDSLFSMQNSIYLKNHYILSNPVSIFHFLDDIQLFSTKRQLMCGLQSSISLCSILSSLSQSTLETMPTDTTLNSSSQIPDNLKNAIRYIRSHYAEKISLEELSEHCHISKQQLIRYFHTTFHCTPIAYITDYKISCAKDLLFNQPHLTIKEISDELGFNNQHYFAKVFLKSTGETPSHYRERTLHYQEPQDL